MISKFSTFIREKYSHVKFLNDIKSELNSGKGGKEFFNTIDKYIKNSEDIMEELCNDLQDEWIVSSGTFGDNLYSLYEKGKIKTKGMLIFNGKILTRNKGINSYYPHDFEIENKEYVFVDDSFFSGKTMSTIEEYLEDHNSSIKLSKIAYDGSVKKNPKVRSLYRYYDHH